jgi:hypothetical protein
MLVLIEPFDRILEDVGEHWDVQDLSCGGLLFSVKFCFPLPNRPLLFFFLVLWW